MKIAWQKCALSDVTVDITGYLLRRKVAGGNQSPAEQSTATADEQQTHVRDQMNKNTQQTQIKPTVTQTRWD